MRLGRPRGTTTSLPRGDRPLPEPQWVSGGMDSLEKPSPSLEILGRGEGARKSKTFIKDQELAALLGFIRGHTRRLMEAFRRLHERHFKVVVEEELPDGTKVKREIPEVLNDDQLRTLYPIIAEWERMHQEQVEHYASIGGFSVNAAAGIPDEAEGKKRSESSAGADRRSKTGASKVAGTEPKWR